MLQHLIHRVITSRPASYETMCVGEGMLTVALVHYNPASFGLTVTHRVSGTRVGGGLTFFPSEAGVQAASEFRDELLAAGDWSSVAPGDESESGRRLAEKARQIARAWAGHDDVDRYFSILA